MSDEKPNGWNESKKLVSYQLETLEQTLKDHIKDSKTSDEKFRKSFNEFQIEVIAEIRVIKAESTKRAGWISAVTSFLTVLGGIFLLWISGVI